MTNLADILDFVPKIGSDEQAKTASKRTPTGWLFQYLHGCYGSLFLSQYASGVIDAKGHDRGVYSDMQVWASELAEFPQDVIETVARGLGASNPKYPPSLPAFCSFCKAAMPRKTYADDCGVLPAKRLPLPSYSGSHTFKRMEDGKDPWRDVLVGIKNGRKRTPTIVQMALEGLAYKDLNSAWADLLLADCPA